MCGVLASMQGLASLADGQPGSPSASSTRGGPAGKTGAMSVVSMAAVARKGGSEFDFNLGVTKARVIKSMDDRAPLPFKRFYNSPLFDRLLNACLLYFTSRFMHDWIVRAMEKARKQHLEGYNPYAVAQRLQELEEEMESQRIDLSPIYSEIILKHSKYDKPQHDKMFFECLYETLVLVLDDAFAQRNLPQGGPGAPGAPASTAGGVGATASGQGAGDASGAAGSSGTGNRREEIESEVGSLFRSKHFNANKRRHSEPRSVDTLGVKELYALKHETTNRALNAKMLSSLHTKPPTLAVQVASVTNSPLISQYISSPIVARAKCKDPAERAAMAKTLARATTNNRSSPRATLGRAFRSVATARGIDVSGLKEHLGSMRLGGGDTAAADQLGLMSQERSYKDRRVQPKGVLAPESVGLAADEQFNYLCLLKRYVQYGPTLGMAPGAAGLTGLPPPAAGAAAGGMSFVGGGALASSQASVAMPGSPTATGAPKMSGFMSRMGLTATGSSDY